MLELQKSLDAKKFFFFILISLIATNIAILLNIPFLRQILGFLFLTFLPGLLLLQILKLNKIGFTEKVVLSVGLSISFLMFFGLLINNLSLTLDYEKPLSTIAILISFNIAYIILAIFGYKTNRNTTFSIPNFKLTKSEKAFLVLPILFPALCILGTHLMKTADDNIILMFLLVLIAIYVVFVFIFNQRFPKRLYPIVIFLISISLLLIFALRFPHICGHDVHKEYGYYFLRTLENLHWDILGTGSSLDACLSISLLPTIYQSILKTNAHEYLFKGIYVSISCFGPLAIYVISKKYVEEPYAFLATLFFMSQSVFLQVAGSPRTNVAIFFVALAIMVLFHDKISSLTKRLLFIVFMLSTIVSHYSTAYIFFFIMLGCFVGVAILPKQYTQKKFITLSVTLLFFICMFFWYSQLTETAFDNSVKFMESTFSNMHNFFVEEARAEIVTQQLVGKKLETPVLSRANLAFTWGSFILIGTGVFTLIRRYKELVDLPTTKHKKQDFLKTGIEIEYFVMILVCVGLLIISIVLPFVSIGYDIFRIFFFVLIILSICFVIGGMSLSKHFFFLKNAALPKKQQEGRNDKIGEGKGNGESAGGKKASHIWAYSIILVILIPYFLFQTGVIYQLFGVQYSLCLGSKGEIFDIEYISDSESCAVKWFALNTEGPPRIFASGFGSWYLASQGKIKSDSIDTFLSIMPNKGNWYIYLHYTNVVKGIILVKGQYSNITEYSDSFSGINKIYNSGSSEIWKT